MPEHLRTKLTDRQVKIITSAGGLGVHKTQEGQHTHTVAVLPSGNRVTPYKVVVYRTAPPKRKNLSTDQKEHQEFMEDLMEYESSGRHPNVKPLEAGRAKKRLKSYVDNGRLVAGVDV